MTKSLSRLFLPASPFLAAAHVGWYYSELPERVASHFGSSGAADGWTSRTAFVATYVGLIGAMGLLYNGLAWGLPRLPVSMINLPRRDYWLSPERRERTLQDLGEQIAEIGTAFVLFLMLVFHLSIRANLDKTFRLDPAVVGSALIVFLAVLVCWLGRLIWRYARTGADPAD